MSNNKSNRCCKCNSAGTCSNCVCKKNGSQCVSCVPGGKSKCNNGGNQLPFTTIKSDASGNGGANHSQLLPRRQLSASQPCSTAPLSRDHTAQSTFSQPSSIRAGNEESASRSFLIRPSTINQTNTGSVPEPPDVATDGGECRESDCTSQSVDSTSIYNCPAMEGFGKSVRDAYEAVVRWKRNLFNIPYGSVGAKFVDELAAMIKGFSEPLPSRQIAWKAICVACHLLLQKTSPDGSNAVHSQHLERRLALWRSGYISDLFDESACIQQHLSARKSKRYSHSDDGISDTVFSKLVFDGKIQSAIRYISEDSSGGVLNMDDVVPGTSKSVRDALYEKHPRASMPMEDVLLDEVAPTINPVVFERLTPKLIKDVARQSKGAAGPSGLDAEAWKRMLTCFKQSSDRLCASLAAAAKAICTSDLTGVDLSAFTAARLIPLDKRPGVRPIAVGEVFRRIICKAIMRVIQNDVLSCTAPLQICVGVPSACEAAVHTMDRLFRKPSIQGMLLVDASNAFNALNRSAALHNVPRVCPALATVFTNTYRKPIRLFVTGGGEISSEEGTCQGDPLAMAIYAVAIMPLIWKLQSACPSLTQCWYADDDGAADDLITLHKYWTLLNEIGPGYGYFPNSTKTVLLTKPEHQNEASRLFEGTGVTVRSDGCRYLGGAVGEKDFCCSFLKTLAKKWADDLRTLSDLARTQPHAAYTVFTKGLSHRWRYHIRCTECPPDVFTCLDDIINTSLLPALTGREFTNEQPDRSLLSLPARLGGLAIPILSHGLLTAHEFKTSQVITQPIVDLVAPPDGGTDSSKPNTTAGSELQANTSMPASGTSDLEVTPRSSTPDGNPALVAVSASIAKTRDERVARSAMSRQAANSLYTQVSDPQQLLLSIASAKGVSAWLTAEPSRANGLVLNKSDFRDAVCLRYGFPLDGLPTTCVCGNEMTVDHAMTCPCGGYPIARHNEVRDIVADAMRSAFHDVETEPQLLPYAEEDLSGRTANRSEAARADIRARGFWTRQQEAFFDIRVTHPKATLHTLSQLEQQLTTNEREKKRQYAERVNTIDRAAFTPLVFSTNGMVGKECEVCLKSLAAAILDKNIDLTYSQVMHHLRCKLSVALLRWGITCLRGCRASYRRNRKCEFLAECRLMSQHAQRL